MKNFLTPATISDGFSSQNFSREDEIQESPVEPTSYLKTEDPVFNKNPPLQKAQSVW
jgi:hypothetical protein